MQLLMQLRIAAFERGHDALMNETDQLYGLAIHEHDEPPT